MIETTGLTNTGFRSFLFFVLMAVGTFSSLYADEQNFIYFNTNDIGEPNDKVPLIQPFKIVSLDPDYGGQWVVAGDVDGDGAVEIVSSENYNKDDVHDTTTAVVQDLDGSVLWRWGNPDVGRKNWHHDVACQIHDWDADGKNEVILCTKGALVVLEGATGHELRRIPIHGEATDCLVFCNLSGGGRPTDVLVKDRYHQIWAYNRRGDLLWTVKDPGGFRTAHQPRPIDIDGDGRDEILAGYAMLNPNGSVRWVFQSEKVDQAQGHLDCARIVRRGTSPEAFRIAITLCGANSIALIDGDGKVLWEIAGRHFESIDVGHIIPDHAGPHICVDIDHQPYGKSPIWVLDEAGRPLGRLVTDYSRHHCLLDWTGDGVEEILVANKCGLYNHRGQRIGTFSTSGLKTDSGQTKYEKSLLIGDMTGNGICDVIIATPNTLYVYKNTLGKKSDTSVPLGTEFNMTLY